MAAPDGLKRWIGCGFGSGWLPGGPGTWGSLAALPFAIGTWHAGGTGALAALALFWCALSVWSTATCEARYGHDPGVFVMDEFAGQTLALVPAALWGLDPTTWPVLLVGFGLFRLFDIWKPGPIGRLQSLPGAAGVLADDLLAGLVAGIAGIPLILCILAHVD